MVMFDEKLYYVIMIKCLMMVEVNIIKHHGLMIEVTIKWWFTNMMQGKNCKAMIQNGACCLLVKYHGQKQKMNPWKLQGIWHPSCLDEFEFRSNKNFAGEVKYLPIHGKRCPEHRRFFFHPGSPVLEMLKSRLLLWQQRWFYVLNNRKT